MILDTFYACTRTPSRKLLAIFILSAFFLINMANALAATSIKVPPGIQYYLPITVTNYQGTAVAANTPIAIGTNFIGGNALSSANTVMTGFNAVAYQQYETCNLNNAEFFLGNGTVLNSWMEGNVLAELVSNPACTSASSANALASSANVLYWVKIPTNTFLPANTGTATTNTIYLGWAGNVISPVNNLLTDGAGAGEAPTLSTGYGQYDNGANVFSSYFNGDTPASGFKLGSNNQQQQVTGVTIGSDTNANVLYLTGYGTDRYNLIYDTAIPNGNYVVESNYYPENGLANNQGVLGLTDTPTAVTNGNALAVNIGYASTYFGQTYVSDGTVTTGLNRQGTSESAWLFATANYTQTSATWEGFTAPQLYSATGGYSGSTENYLGNAVDVYLASLGSDLYSNQVYMYYNWMRARINPPNGILPATTFGTITPSCAAYITSPSNAVADAGQYESFTASESNCISTYTYNIIVANSITPSTIAHNDLITGSSATSITYSFQTASADTSNSPEEANVVVTDSGSNTVTSVYSSTFVINPALGIPTLTSSPTLPSNQAQGNTITFTTTASGGTSPYTYNYLITNTVTGALVANMLFTNVASTSNSFAWTIPQADIGNTVQANVIVTDSASTPETANSVKSGTLTITYNPPSTPVLSSCPSSAKLDVSQTVSCTATVSGGISPYTFNWLIVNSITGAITSNMLFTNVASTSNTFEYDVAHADVSNSPEMFNVIVTDSYPTTINSAYSGNFYSAYLMPAPSITPSNPVVDSGQSVIFSSTWANGFSPYTAKLYSSSTSTCNTGSVLVQTLSSLASGSAIFTAVSPASNTYYCIFVTDSATTPMTVHSTNSEITVNPSLSVPSISPYNPIIDIGQSVTLSSSWSGGTPTYGASLYSSPTSTCNQQSTLVQQDIGLSANSVTFSPVTPPSNTYYCTFVTDNTPYAYSISNSITTGIGDPHGIAVAPSGTYAYVSNCNGYCSLTNPSNVVIVNLATNAFISTIPSGIFDPVGIAFAPSGTYAYVANGDSNNVVIINTVTNTVTSSITSGFSHPQGVAFSPSGTYAYVTNYNSNNVVIINTATNSVAGSITAGFNAPTGAAISPSGTYAYVANYNSINTVIINTATNTVTGVITRPFYFEPYSVAISPSGTYAYLTDYATNTIAVIDTATNTITGTLNIGFFRTYGAAFSPDGLHAYVLNNYGANQGSNVIVLNTGTATTNSINSDITVNPALGIPTLTASNAPTVNTGQYESFTASWSGGTAAYAANYQIFNSITDNLLANALYTGITGTSNTFLWQVPNADFGNTVSANVFITDSASTPVTVNSIELSTVAISSTSTSTTSTATTTVSSGGGGNSGGVIIHPPSTSVSTTSTTSASSTSSTSSISSTTISSTTSTSSTSILTTTLSTLSTTIKPVVIVRVANVSKEAATRVNFTDYNLTVALSTSSNTTKHVAISFYAPTTANVTLRNYTNIFSFFLNESSSEVSMNLTIEYNCKYGSEVVPFVYENDSWNQIYGAIILRAPCRISFPAPNRHKLGLFVYNYTNPTASSTSTSSTITTTISAIRLTTEEEYYAAGAAVAITAILAYLLAKRIAKKRRE